MKENIDLTCFRPVKIDQLIRLGNKYDGGYVVHGPSLKSIDFLVTYGVGYNAQFELAFAKYSNAKVLAFDPTMKDASYFIEKLKKGQIRAFLGQIKWLIKWLMKEPELKKHHIKFVQEGIATSDDTANEKFKSFDEHIEKYNLQNSKLVLKIDIDGGEHSLFEDRMIYDKLDQIEQLILEFHYLDTYLEETAAIFNELSKTHSLIHIHGNNYGEPFIYNGKKIPKVIEATFLSNKHISDKNYSTEQYPRKGLDAPCYSKKEDMPLDFFY